MTDITVDQVRTALREIHFQIGKDRESAEPFLSLDSAYRLRQVTDTAISFLNDGDTQGFSDYLWGDFSAQEPDLFDHLVGELLVKLNLESVDPIFLSFRDRKFGQP